MSQGIKPSREATPSPVRGARVMVEQVVVRRGAFHDPVTLMAAAEEAQSVAGVEQVAVGMADRLNLTIIRGRHGYDLGSEDSLGPEDLVIALRAVSDAAAERAF